MAIWEMGIGNWNAVDGVWERQQVGYRNRDWRGRMSASWIELDRLSSTLKLSSTLGREMEEGIKQGVQKAAGLRE